MTRFFVCATATMAAVGAATVARAQPGNDTCLSAFSVFVPSTTPATNAGATSDVAASACALGDDADVWFRFTAPHPEFAVVYQFDTFGSAGLTDTTLSVYFGECPGEAVLCNDDTGGGRASMVRVPMFPNETILVRVAGYAGATGEFVLNVSQPVLGDPVPANDECGNATPLGYPVTLRDDTINATGFERTFTCGDFDNKGVWYRFVAPETREYQFYTSEHFSSMTLAAFDDDCAGLEFEIGCVSRGPWDFNPTPMPISLQLEAGQAVRLRAAFNDDGNGDFKINVGPFPVLPAPANDLCENAQALTLPASVTGTTAGATGFIPSDYALFGCSFNDEADVWYRFTPPVTGRYRLDTNGSALAETVLSIWTACPDASGLSMFVQCDDRSGEGRNSAIVRELNGGTQYYVRVAGRDRTSGDFRLSVGAAAPAANAACAGAVEFTGSVTGSLLDGLYVETLPCTNSSGHALWYTFVAPGAGYYRFTVAQESTGDYSLGVYGGCGTGLIACGRYNQTIVPMSAGQRVYLQVGGTPDGTFTLGVEAAFQGPANDLCENADELVVGQVIQASTRDATGYFPPDPNSRINEDQTTDVWYRFTAPATDTYTFTVEGFIRPGLAILSDCTPSPDSRLDDVNNCTNPFNPDTRKTLRLRIQAGVTVYARVVGCPDPASPPGPFSIWVEGTEPVTGACCDGGVCTVTTENECAGEFQGEESTCDPDPCVPPCRADFDGQNGVQVADIFAFLRAWFAQNPSADFDGQNGIQVADIFAFLRAWFAGC